MKNIAAAANMSYQTLYNYFSTKAIIVQTIVLQDVASAAKKSEALIANYQTDPVDLIFRGAKLQLDMVSSRDRHLWREFVVEYLKQSQELVAAYEHTDVTAHARIQKALRTTQKKGHLHAEVDLEVLSNVVYNITEMAFLSYIMRPSLDKKTLMGNFRAQLAILLSPYLCNPD